MKVTDRNGGSPLTGYLDIMALQPLDVIVCSSACDKHRRIQKWSSGCFAHAALLVSPMVTFESGLDGLFFRVTNELRFACVGNSLHLVMPLSEYTHFKILRHPELSSVSRSQLNDVRCKALNSCEELNLLNYPRLLRLVAAIPGLGATANMAAKLLCISDRLTKSQITHGLFCSELVASVFEDIKLPILNSGTSPATASSQDIANSVLVEVTDAILPPETDCTECPSDVRGRILRPYVRLRQQFCLMSPTVSVAESRAEAPAETTVLMHRKQRSEDTAKLLCEYQRMAGQLSIAEGTAVANIQQEGEDAILETIAIHRRAEPDFIRDLITSENELFDSLLTENSSIEEIRASIPECIAEPIQNINAWINDFTSPIVTYLDKHNPQACVGACTSHLC